MNKITKNIAALIAFGIGTTTIGFAQITQQKIGNNPTLINPNAALEVESTTKGILLPRLGLTATNNVAPLAAHVAGMTVYNTATSGTAPNNVTPGYYYNDGSQWVRVATGADAKTEPWRQQTTTNEATANTQSIYQSGNVAVGDFSGAASTKKMEVKGDFKSEITVTGGVVGTEIGSPLNPNGAMHYWSNGTDYRTASANDLSATLEAKTGTTTNSFAAGSTQAQMASQNGTNSLSTIRTTNTGNFFMETYNVTGQYGSTMSLQNDGLRMVHTNTNGAADPFLNNNRSELMVQKENGVRFSFRNNTGITSGEYWFPLTTGTNGQIMTQTSTGKMVWTSPSALSVPEVDGVIGNEVTNATTNGGLTRTGAGTNVSPYTLGLTAGSATGNVMTWNGTAWNPGAPVNIYNANGSLTSNRVANLNGNSLRFTSPERDIYLDNNGRLGVMAKGTNDADIYLTSGSGPTYNRFDIQSFPSGEVNLTTTGSAEQMMIATHMTTLPASLVFSTSEGSNASAIERMRITGTGNIGITTYAPSEKLDVAAGNVRIRDIYGLAGSSATDKIVVATTTGVLKTISPSLFQAQALNYSYTVQETGRKWVNGKKVHELTADITLATNTNLVTLPAAVVVDATLIQVRFINKTTGSISTNIIKYTPGTRELILGTAGLMTTLHPAGDYYLIVEYVGSI